ncbi:MAG TPA: lipase maturation factor family protein [Steroidobacteraceae bacterium]|nr:lipase maturation factor family protein [Steroidobacteraceae bacterium]
MSDPSADSRPLLVFDADCAFCVFWARYWQKLTGETVNYQPYQKVTSQYPQIPLADFQRAVQFIARDGRRAGAAEASFLTLSHARGKEFWLTLYKRLPGFAPLAEWTYAFIAARRSAFYRITLLLWGRDYGPPRYDLVSFVFLRLIGLIYLSAFISFGVQAQGLIGSHGILPIAELAQRISDHSGVERFFAMPMLFWINASDLAIRLVCWGGAGFSLLLIFNVLPRLSLLALYALYLSLLYAGQTFTSFQWDTFLLEAGFLSLLLSFAPTPGIWLLRWLLFRFMFMSGAVKLFSGDPHWWDLSALSYHFFTQPLPTPLAWYAAHLSTPVLRFATAGMFFVELILPFLIFCPRRLRFCAAFGILLLESCILITGNYNWFNLQTMLLCLLLFDDAAFQQCLPQRLVQVLSRRVPQRSSKAASIGVRAWGLILVFVSLVQMDERFGGSPPAALRAMDQLIEPMRMVSSYGLFAVMTTERNEIIIEGSDDGVEWREYAFQYKPGDVARRPPWNIPHQPRLDWQMWFAALDDPRRVNWFAHFLERLLQNEPTVTALVEKNPFAAKAPQYIRAQFYGYTFSTAEERQKGVWWQRRSLGLYFPVVRLKGK